MEQLHSRSVQGEMCSDYQAAVVGLSQPTFIHRDFHVKNGERSFNEGINIQLAEISAFSCANGRMNGSKADKIIDLRPPSYFKRVICDGSMMEQNAAAVVMSTDGRFHLSLSLAFRYFQPIRRCALALMTMKVFQIKIKRRELLRCSLQSFRATFSGKRSNAIENFRDRFQLINLMSKWYFSSAKCFLQNYHKTLDAWTLFETLMSTKWA